ncbi:GNAT family N-acetyltransferase [Actinoplanes sp. NPDC049596]|uniref:GNAT family N-acetyltransferase n=1 Tax=unclassified Actinoplanes TaxID=2626549 RepID=UPI003413A8BC
MDDSVHLRTATTADLPAIADLMGQVFHEHVSDDFRDWEMRITEAGRSLVADDGGLVVGHATAQTRELSVPGAVVPAAHVTGVGVAPTHRRRGLLSGMMRRQLTEIAEAGREAVAVLWASETAIYPRFGYGPATDRLRLEVATREVRITAPVQPVRLRMVKPLEAREELAALHDRLRADRPGWSSRADHWWEYLLRDGESQRDGATSLYGVIVDGDAGPAGYALWRVKDGWNSYGPDGTVRIQEIVAADPVTYTELWRFLLTIDLARTASFGYATLDEPLQYLVDEPRRLGRTFGDGLWVRLVDVPAALAARRYLHPVDVVIEVTDPIIEANNGRWRLTADQDKTSAVRSAGAPDFSCSVTELGAAYLGGTSLAALAAAGRVRQLTENFPSAAFGWHRQPGALEVF